VQEVACARGGGASPSSLLGQTSIFWSPMRRYSTFSGGCCYRGRQSARAWRRIQHVEQTGWKSGLRSPAMECT